MVERVTDSLEEFANQRVSDLEATAKRLTIALRREKVRTEALVEAVHTAAHDAATVAGRPKAPRVRTDRRKARAEVALLHATDWQVGKRTEDYNSTVAAERMRLMVEKVAKITEIHRADHPVRECVLMLGGDMIEGILIFPGQAFEIDSTLYEQVFTTANIIEQLIVDLLAVFETVRVIDVHGNHGRVGKKGEAPTLDNLDRMIYRIVRDRTSDPRVTWQHAETWHQLVEIGNYRALLVHGDQIKMFGGNTPVHGILRKFNNWKGGVTAPFRDGYVGHFHQHQSLLMSAGGHVFMTGSPESSSEYAAEFIAAKGTPSQRLHFIDPERGRVTSEHQVHLDD